MGLLQPYVGTYARATSASSKLDVESILAGCDAVDDEVVGISEISSKISQAGSSITKDVLSIDDMDISGSLDECCTGISNTYSNILETTSAIRERAVAVYNQLQAQYNEEAKIRDENAKIAASKENNE